jgi:hypothetical protein
LPITGGKEFLRIMFVETVFSTVSD